MLNNNYLMELMKQPVRTVESRVLYYAGGGNSYTAIRHNQNLKSFTVERIGEEGKFFGFGICHKANIKLRDVNREYSFTTADMFRPVYVDRGNGAVAQVFCYPKLYVSECHRDENTNELSITLYDKIYEATKHTVSELTLPENYSFLGFIAAVANFLGVNSYQTINMGSDKVFSTIYPGGANFEGTETLRDALNAVAEATQTIYYLDKLNTLTFKRLDIDGDAALTIEKDDYITLDSKTNRRLTNITHATELGDNVSAALAQSGSTQYVRDNPFWELREDIDTLVENALAAVGGLTINQFTCSWRGNVLLEVGDKIELITKDDETVVSYVLHDVLTYDGALKEDTQWNYTTEETETESNPSTLGEALKHTYAKVDKANKRIDMVVSDVDANSKAMAAINVNLESITSTLRGVENTTNSSLEDINEEIAKIYNEVETKMTKDDYSVLIKDVIEENGVEKVITKAGYKFDEEGLTVSRANSQLETTISDNGMVVKKSGEDMLTANEDGVNAKNLHATTYLIIGTNSRFEDYDNKTRTGCFWVGG